MRSRWEIGTLLAVLAVAALVYGQGLHHPWHFDDGHSITRNETIRSLSNVGRFFGDPASFSAHDNTKTMYRPVLLLSYALTYAVAGYSLPVWRGVQIGLHLLTVLALYLFLCRFVSQPLCRLVPVACVALHPINSHAVCYLSSRSEILVSLGIVVTLYCFVRWRQEARSHWLALSLVAAVLALLTKSVAVSIPILVFLWEAWFGEAAQERRPWQAAIVRALPYVVLVIAYFILRRLLLGQVLMPAAVALGDGGIRWFRDHPSSLARAFGPGRSLWTNFLVQVTAFWKYLFLVLWPPSQSVVHDLPVDVTVTTLPTVLTVPLFVGMLLTMIAIRRSRPLFSFGVLFLVAAMAPTSLMPLNLIMNEHRLYLGSLGLFLACTAAVLAISAKLTRPRCLVIALGLVLCLYTDATVRRVAMWGSPLALWGDAVEKAPRNYYARAGYAMALRKAGFDEESLFQAVRAVQRHPRPSSKLVEDLALRFADRGDYLLAERYATKLTSRSPDDKQFVETVLYVLAKTKGVEPVLKQYRRLVGDCGPTAGLERLGKELAVNQRTLQAFVTVGGGSGDGRQRFQALVALGRWTEADRLFKTGTAALRSVLVHDYARLLVAMRRWQQLLAFCNEVLAERATDWQLREFSAIARAKVGDRAAARDELTALLARGVKLSFTARDVAKLPPFDDDIR